MDESLPIDIHTGKLVEWLISRRHIKKNWPDSIQVVREKINAAIQDMPEHPEIIRLLSGSYINYYHCVQIVEILRETEKDSKNIFGWYSSQRMKDWQEIINLYERDALFLAEVGQFLVRNVSYEGPSLKRQIGRSKVIQEECDRKEEDIKKSAKNAKERYFSLCKQMDIKGTDVHAELIGLLDDLPKQFEKLAQKSKGLEEATAFYKDFIDFTLYSGREASSPSPDSVLMLLHFVMKHGDATMYELKYGEAPISIEKPTLEVQKLGGTQETIDFGVEESHETSDALDFGDFEVISKNIDFGDEPVGTDLESAGDIDWGNMDNGGGDTQIDWEDVDGDVKGIVVEDSGLAGGVAKGDEALTVLCTPSTRNKFINELLELLGFLRQRSIELNGTETILSMSQFTYAPKSVQYQSIERIASHIDLIEELLKVLQSTKMQHLYLISSSPRYVVRLTKSIQTKLLESEKLISNLGAIDLRRKGALEDFRKCHTTLKQMGDKTRELQRKVEESISKKYNNRVVNLMGSV